MYSEVEKAMTRQKVSLEVLSYHTKATDKEVQDLMERPVPEAEHLNLYSLEFNDFSLQPDETILAAVRMFEELQLTSEFNIRRLSSAELFRIATNKVRIAMMIANIRNV
ncbi:cGMP-specific 3',5'-cyclic phosphodiesterase-like [Diaphorina citri]|uniref:cGMP-specific 3',5'-cyclic phosphodiesterase-like n=1 Tax=Diaphorina citri TaxID=121845 RepID=A0A1S3DLS3_DIACI|nr:cGMP-specific 3',5'-cyclic phosphodiesterase-like [Diaphorina citri]